MSYGALEYRQGTASASDIKTHLTACDARFDPLLSSRVDVASYAAKLAEHAETFEAWRGGALAGLVAAYFNGQAGSFAFISSVSVVADVKGAGVATRLMHDCLDAARRQGLRYAELQVSRASSAAIALYRKLGFAESGGDTATLTMRLPFADPAHR